MTACVATATKRQIEFAPFSLPDCRPKGVSDKLERGDSDTMDATLHSNERMVPDVYDRRRIASPSLPDDAGRESHSNVWNTRRQKDKRVSRRSPANPREYWRSGRDSNPRPPA